MSYQDLKAKQIEIEEAYSRKGIKDAVMAYMDTIPEVEQVIVQGANLLQNWCESESAYESKQVRKDHISQMDLVDLTKEVFVRVACLATETTLANLASQMAGMLGFSDKRDGIKAMAEILAVLCDTNFYNLVKPHIQASVYVVSNFHLPDDLLAYVERACYLPPLLVKPKKLVNNRSSGYQTVKGDSLILGGSINHHNDKISLDVLNIMNAYKLTLNTEVLFTIPELPTHDLDVIEDPKDMTQIEIMKAISMQKNNWNKHLAQSQYFYSELINNGNVIYITNKFDKRGRIYSQGHHINPQGNSYKKAMLDLHDKERVVIPDGYFTKSE